MSNKSPKSAVELAMEKLAKQDAETGSETHPLTDTQKELVAAARRDYEAKAAECRIMHEANVTGNVDPDARSTLEANLRRDLAQLATDRDRKVSAALEQTDILDIK